MGKSETADSWAAFVRFKQISGYSMKQAYPRVRWQHSFYDHIIRSDESIEDAIAYIARNPVRAGLAATWQSYPYSGSIGWDLDAIMAGLIK